VITLTLTFTSIEAARAALLEIPSSSLVGGPAPEAKVEAPKKVTKEAPAPVERAQAATKTVATPDPKPVAEGTTSSAKPSESVDYPTLQKAVFALAGKSREAAGAVAAALGVKTFKELDSSKWAEALAAVNVALEAA
jgi:hypothetical protein